MTVNELIYKLQEIKDMNPDAGRFKIVVPVEIKGMIGGTPSVSIESVYSGFDWNKGKMFLQPEKELITLNGKL